MISAFVEIDDLDVLKGLNIAFEHQTFFHDLLMIVIVEHVCCRCRCAKSNQWILLRRGIMRLLRGI